MEKRNHGFEDSILEAHGDETVSGIPETGRAIAASLDALRQRIKENGSREELLANVDEVQRSLDVLKKAA